MGGDILSNLVAGLVLGLSAGFAPGPILALVIGETLSGGLKDGLKVAASPLITDGPIIIAGTLLLAGLGSGDAVLGIVSLIGGAYLVKLGLESFKAPANGGGEHSSDALKKAVLANFLNPHPYLFWLTVGSPLLIAGLEKGVLAPAAFLAGFYVCLVGSKAGIAVAAARSRAFLQGKGYRLVLGALGVALIVFAGLFVHKGLTLLGVL